MDLIKIHERAKKAGINIDIIIEAEGYDTDQVIIKGSTITENYYESQHYARMFPLHELEYLTVRGEDIIELAMDEIIKNLGKSEMDWYAAETRLQDWIDTFMDRRLPIYFKLKLESLEVRLRDGERTQELYDEIMGLNKYFGGINHD